MTYAQDLAALGGRADDQVAALIADAAKLTATVADLQARLAALAPPPPPPPPPVVPSLSRIYPGWTKIMAEDFNTPAAAGSAYSAYAHAISGYGDSGLYRVGNVSVHDGMLDIAIPGGAVATPGTGGVVVIGPPATRWARLWGKFTVRFKAVGASETGAAFMLWPSSNRWSDGEIDYPEGGFGGTIHVYHHPTPCYPDPAAPIAGQPYCGTNTASLDTKTTWRDWHEASTEWRPGSVAYYLDDVLIKTVSTSVPTTNHRWTVQAADPQKLNTGEPGNLLLDWVRIDALA